MSNLKPTLYTFEASVWAAAAELAAAELGYTSSHLDTKSINLIRGENFDPNFLALNQNGTLPTLTAPSGETYTSTADVVRYLIVHAPSPVHALADATGKDLIEKVHAKDIDPNFSLLSARNEAELQAKAAAVPGAFLRGRQETLTRHVSATPTNQEFYNEKLTANAHLFALFSMTPPLAATQAFFASSAAHWVRVIQFIASLPRWLPKAGAYVGGAECPGEADYHLAAWLARTVGVIGGTPGPDGVSALEGVMKAEGGVPEAVRMYWAMWSERESWKVLYKDGLH